MKYIALILFFISTSLSFSQSESKYKCISEFDRFFDKFSVNPDYQKAKILYPLKLYYIYNLTTGEQKTKVFNNHKEWKFRDFSKDKLGITEDKEEFTVTIKTIKNKKLYKLKGVDSTMDITYWFEKIKDCWYLTRINDKSRL